MALLNLGKKKAEEQQSQDVPDELPDLPQAVENGQEQVETAHGVVPDELPPVDLSSTDLAPDELPPVTGSDASVMGSETNSLSDDRRLYFSNILQKLHEEGIKSTKLTIPSANFLSDMKKHWKKQKKSEALEAMNRSVAENIGPLQQLEREWVALQDDIEGKKRLLHEKEEKIKNLSEELKKTASKAEKMNSVKK